MKYLCLVHYAEAEVYGGLSQEEWRALVGQCLAYGEHVRSSGHFLGGHALLPVHTAKTVRAHGAGVTDGPFAETKEQLAGYYLFESRDLNEVIRVSSGIPPARLGSIEIRPVEGAPASLPETPMVATRPRFLCLLYGTERATSLDALIGTTPSSIVALAGLRIATPDTATTLRVRDGRVGLMDGPAAAPNPPLDAVIAVEADSVDSVLGWAATLPVSGGGGVEVRPVRDLLAE